MQDVNFFSSILDEESAIYYLYLGDSENTNNATILSFPEIKKRVLDLIDKAKIHVTQYHHEKYINH